MNWKTACKIAAPAAACAGAFAFLVAPGHATRAQKAPFLYRNYAHRGLHTEDGTVPENSLPAFRAAAEAGYAVEMDVHLTADDQLVVFHDDTLERMCGVPGVIDDFTLAELRALRLGDTDCVIPTFAEALAALGGRTASRALTPRSSRGSGATRPISCAASSASRRRTTARRSISPRPPSSATCSRT